jgi:methyl-accepting chemotaxis protein
VQANNVIDAVNAIARHLRNGFIYSGAEQQKSIDSIAVERKTINDNLEKLDKSITSVKGREMLKKVSESRAAYVVDQDNAKTHSQAKTQLHVFDEIHDFFS